MITIEKFNFNNRRLLFKISTMYQKYMLKIFRPTDNFHQESLIYQELKEQAEIDISIKGKIVEICDNGYWKTDSIIKLSLHGNNYEFDFSKFKNDLDNISQKLPYLEFFVTKYDEKYMIFKNFVQINAEKINNKILTDFYLNLFNLLFYLNQKIGFNHWDLHIENILLFLKNGTIRFKIFDFDLSTTNKFPVAHHRYKNKTIDFASKKQGICHDIVVIFSLNMYGNKKYFPENESDTLNRQIQELKKLVDTYYKDLHYVNWKFGNVDNASIKRCNTLFGFLEKILKN